MTVTGVDSGTKAGDADPGEDARRPAAADAPAALGRAGLETWKDMLRITTLLVDDFDHNLRERHGLAIGDYDVLAHLDDAPDGALRMCDLAAAVVLSASGLSRRVDRLERVGLVQRRRAESDGRSIETALTPAGRQLLDQARTTHRADIKERFADHFDDDELEILQGYLGRILTAERAAEAGSA